MTAPDTNWKVLAHDPLRQLAENLWHVEGDLPGMPLRRHMIVARLGNGDLVIHNAIAMDDAGMAALEALGRPAWLVVPNGWHRIDAARFKARYPDLKVVCPAGARVKVEQVVAVDATYDTLPQADPGDDTVRFEHFGGGAQPEGAMWVRSADGATVVLTDAFFNLPHGKGFFWFVYGRLFGNTGGPRVTTIARTMFIKGETRKAYKAWLERAAARSDLVRVVPGHGAILVDHPAAALAKVAATL